MFQSAVCAVSWGGSLPRTVSLIVLVLWDPERKASLVTRASCSRDVPWVEAAKTRTLDVKTEILDIKTRTPDVCNNSPLGDSGAVEPGRGGMQG